MLTNTLPLGVLWGSNGSICAKQLEQCRAYSKDSVSELASKYYIVGKLAVKPAV